MKVTIDYYETTEFEGPDTLGVYLDDGEEVGRYCIVADPGHERNLLEGMLLKVQLEAEDHFREILRPFLAKAAHHSECAISPHCEVCTCGLHRVKDLVK